MVGEAEQHENYDGCTGEEGNDPGNLARRLLFDTVRHQIAGDQTQDDSDGK